mmetsp:Transcript_7252/g.14895  ORF Transcript_7252/g.14895 Transcript_7252/m.14895 type:complete len:289 (-) Transcript_7252:150-1016(-)
MKGSFCLIVCSNTLFVFGISSQRFAKSLSEGFHCDVVMGGTDSSTGNHDLKSITQVTNDLGDMIDIVRYHSHKGKSDSTAPQSHCSRSYVHVGHASLENFVSDDDHRCLSNLQHSKLLIGDYIIGFFLSSTLTFQITVNKSPRRKEWSFGVLGGQSRIRTCIEAISKRSVSLIVETTIGNLEPANKSPNVTVLPPQYRTNPDERRIWCCAWSEDSIELVSVRISDSCAKHERSCIWQNLENLSKPIDIPKGMGQQRQSTSQRLLLDKLGYFGKFMRILQEHGFNRHIG